MNFWTILPRWLKVVGLGAIVAAGGAFWLWRQAFAAGQIAERLAGDRARVALAESTRAAKGRAVADAFEQGRHAERSMAALHDSTSVVDSVTVLITLPGPGVARITAVVPSIIVRRIVSDSLALVAQTRIIVAQNGQIVADSGVIVALQAENRTLLASKTPVCGGRCKAAAVVAGAAVVGEVAVRVARALKPH